MGFIGCRGVWVIKVFRYLGVVGFAVFWYCGVVSLQVDS